MPTSLARTFAPHSIGFYRHQVYLQRLYLQSFGKRYPSPSELRTIRSHLSRLETIRYSDGRVVATGIRAIEDTMGSRDKLGGFRLAQQELAALDKSLRAPGVHAPSSHELGQLHNILAESTFHQGTPVTLWTVIAPLARDVTIWFSQRLSVSPGPFALVGVLIVLAVVVMAFVVARRSIQRTLTSSALSMLAQEEMSSSEAGERAHELSSSGRYREALRYLLASVLIRLRENHVIDVWGGLTNRELLAALRSTAAGSNQERTDQAALSALNGLMDHFDDVWYGDGAIDGKRYQDCERLAASAAELGSKAHAA